MSEPPVIKSEDVQPGSLPLPVSSPPVDTASPDSGTATSGDSAGVGSMTDVPANPSCPYVDERMLGSAADWWDEEDQRSAALRSSSRSGFGPARPSGKLSGYERPDTSVNTNVSGSSDLAGQDTRRGLARASAPFVAGTAGGRDRLRETSTHADHGPSRPRSAGQPELGPPPFGSSPTRPEPPGPILSRSERRAIIRRLSGDSHQLSGIVETLATTQAALADLLTGRANQTRRELREAKRKVIELNQNVRGLQVAIETLRRDNDDLRTRLKERDEQMEELRDECQRLRDSASGDAARSLDDERRALFASLGQLLVQLPTVRARINTGTDVPGKQVIGMLKPLDDTINKLGFVVIGSVGETVEFRETHHQPSAAFERAPQPGEPVVIQFVGYQYKGEILRKAQVTPVSK